MGRFVSPTVYLVGVTAPDEAEIVRYLTDTVQEPFLADFRAAVADGVSPGMALCSMFAKLCYKSLVPGRNANVSRTRAVRDNLANCFDVGHGSVFEHCNLNFLVTNCSRVFTHELVRHRAGFAFSQTSGRYCRLDQIDLVWDPLLDPVADLFTAGVQFTEAMVYLAECRLGLRKPPPEVPGARPTDCLTTDTLAQAGRPYVRVSFHPSLGLNMWVPDDSFDLSRRKKITSAIRRIAPNGQANEIGFTVNVRALRHVLMARTAAAAEWEIRAVFAQVYGLVSGRFPEMLHGARTRVVDGLIEVYGMKSQPYEISAGDPAALAAWTTADLEAELKARADAAAGAVEAG